MPQMSDEDIKELRDLITSTGSDDDMPPDEAIGRMDYLRKEIEKLPPNIKDVLQALYQETRTKVLERYRKWIDGEM